MGKFDINLEQAMELLKLKPGFTKEEFKVNYRNLMKNIHPDTLGNINETARKIIEDEVKRVNIAKEVIDSFLKERRSGNEYYNSTNEDQQKRRERQEQERQKREKEQQEKHAREKERQEKERIKREQQEHQRKKQEEERQKSEREEWERHAREKERQEKERIKREQQEQESKKQEQQRQEKIEEAQKEKQRIKEQKKQLKEEKQKQKQKKREEAQQEQQRREKERQEQRAHDKGIKLFFKDILRYIPGFRTGFKWKMVVSIIYYLFSLLMLVSGLALSLFFLSIPFAIFNLISSIKQKKIYNIITSILAFIVFIISASRV